MKTYVCKACGSDQVSRDAWASWDVHSQKWELESVFDQAFCSECDGETTIVKTNYVEPKDDEELFIHV